MLLRVLTGTSASFLLAAAVLLFAASKVHAASFLPHGGNASGVPYYGGQIQSVNDTYSVTERDSAMNNWQSATGRRYINGATTWAVDQWVVYSGSQQDTDLANTYGTHSCAWWHDNGYSGWRSFELGFGGFLNNDSAKTVICLFVTPLGYYPGYDQVDLTTRIRGMTHEMGHSLHLDHDANGVMCTCWSYDINSDEANYVNFIYAIAP